ncbi:DUF3160 domain-containing protein [uncultured Peptoniphilus sp.]|uniref:DUF3160 domain-containing protein n=1 Tax=uncultured Peptoniphilus sp. TaxID=254354 RepID=UPI0028055DB2|nr:DUF3160 domain-containing protein [uncultured Peptoniphilus sp.]
MKKIFISLLIISLLLAGCSKEEGKEINNKGEERVEVKKEEIGFENKMKSVELLNSKINAAYKEIPLKEDFSNLANYGAFDYGEGFSITDEQKQLLLKNGFFVLDSYGAEQPFQIYEFNEYFSNSSFVTTDSMVHLYHVFYDNMLRQVEEDKFLPLLEEFNGLMLEKSLDDYKNTEDEEIKEAAKANVILFATGEFVIGDNLIKSDKSLGIDEEIFKLASDEFKKIRGQSSDISNITGTDLDYSQFIPRGHYTKSDNLKKYFALNMLYSQNKFNFFNGSKNLKSHLLSSLLITRNLVNDDKTKDIYLKVVGTLDFLVEKSEKTDAIDLARLYYKNFNFSDDINSLNDGKKLNNIFEELKKVPIKINPGLGNYFAVIPQKAPIDNTWAQKLVDTAGAGKASNKPKYSGLEIMALLGSSISENIIKNDENIQKWDEYPKRYEEVKSEVENLDKDFWNKNLYRGYFSLMREYNNSYGEGYPKFMTNDEWKKKDINSALGLWAALKHDTILYSEAVVAEMGGGEEVEVGNFVEPNIRLYERLDYLLRFTLENLKARDLLSADQIKGFDNFISLNKFLMDCSHKELESGNLSKEDNDRLSYIGGEMENIFISFVNPKAQGFWELGDKSDRDMAVVADLMKIPENSWNLPAGHYEEVGLGYCKEMYVAYTINGKVFIGIGPVLSYYEFVSEKRLNDEEFRGLLMENKIDELEFTKSYKAKS